MTNIEQICIKSCSIFAISILYFKNLILEDGLNWMILVWLHCNYICEQMKHILDAISSLLMSDRGSVCYLILLIYERQRKYITEDNV